MLPLAVGQEEGLRVSEAETQGLRQGGGQGMTAVGQPVGEDLAVEALSGFADGPLEQSKG